MSTPYYEDDLLTLYHGDWRELIDPALTADLIVTDPPYGETSLTWDHWPDGWPALAARHSRTRHQLGHILVPQRSHLDNQLDGGIDGTNSID